MSSTSFPARPDAPADDRDGDEQESTNETDDERVAVSPTLGLDYAFDILKNQRRRWVLQYLEDRDGTATMNDLAEHIAALENDTTTDALSSRQRKRVYVGLYQCHLPKMDDVDVIDFDKNRGRIEIGPNAAQLDRYLETADDGADRWPLYYLLVSSTGLVLFAGIMAAGVTTTAVAVLLSTFLLAVAGLAVVHHVHRTR